MSPSKLARWLLADSTKYDALTPEQRADKEAFWRKVLNLPKPIDAQPQEATPCS